MPPSLPPAIVIAGPTASGKSALALAIAREFDGVVINADSMQVYGVLRVLTARPSPEEEAQAPHRLYGVLPPSEVCSAARWRDLAAAEMEATRAAGRLPILCGGTGLYIRAAQEGMSPMPDIPAPIREETRALLRRLGNDEFHRRLEARDPVMAARLAPGNSQRLARAWEVMEATGRSLADWQAAPPEGAIPARWLTFALTPPREWLYARCDRRFAAMLDQGALDEVRALIDLDLPADVPAMKALGVPELAAHLRGEADLAAAAEAACRATRNYAKRQLTWFRHQLRAAEPLNEQFSESLLSEIFLKIRRFLLTAG